MRPGFAARIGRHGFLNTRYDRVLLPQSGRGDGCVLGLPLISELWSAPAR
jgi:hypothetical protein